MCSEIYSKNTRHMVLVVITTILVCLILKFYFHKHLSLDGVGYFLHILEHRNFINVSAGRRFSEYLTEWPLVFSVQIGITDIPILVNVFSFGLLLPYLISFSVCLYAVRDGRWSMMLFPLASYIVINMTGDYLLSGEHHVMVLLSWPVLFLLLIERPLTWKEGVVLWALVIIVSRTYETAILPSVIFLSISIFRLYRFSSSKQKIIVLIGIIALLVGIIISITFIMVPRSLLQRQSFIDAIPRNLKIKEVLYYVSFLLIFLCGWALNENNRLVKNLFYMISVVPILYYIYVRITTDYAITSYWSFSSRTLSGFLLPGMLVVATIVHYFRWANNRIGIYIFGFSCFVMMGFNLRDLSNWIDVKNQMQTILNAEHGKRFISIEDTVLKNNQFRFSWNNPSLSLVWSHPCVRRIIVNGDDANWEPFDPKDQVMLKRYLKYGKSFETIDSEITKCRVEK